NLLRLLGGRSGGLLVAGSRSGGFVAGSGLGGALRRSGTFRAFFAFLLFLDHLDVASSSGAFGRSGLFFSARHGYRDNRDTLVTEDFNTLGRLDIADVNSLVQFERSDIDDDLLGQIFGQRADFQLEQYVFEHATAVLDASRFAGRFHGHHDGNFFRGGNFMKID